jgi:ketosteroid isomerase-like protein
MSDPEIEIARRWAEVFDSGDEIPVGEVLHPEVVWHPVEANHEPFRGLEAAEGIRSQWLASWDVHHVVVEDVVRGTDGLVSTGHVTARGLASGVEVDMRLYLHHRFRDGLISYIYEYQDRDEAFAAAGISG